MIKYILALICFTAVLVFGPKDIHSNTTDNARFYNYNVLHNSLKHKEAVEILALNIYHEARGSTYEDKVAVAEVTMNRLRSENYPKTMREVVYQYKQFSWTFLKKNHKPLEREAWRECLDIANDVYYKGNTILDKDVLHYVQSKIVDKVKWAKFFKNRRIIGAHTYLS